MKITSLPARKSAGSRNRHTGASAGDNNKANLKLESGVHAREPDTVEAMADHAADFLSALNLSTVALLGFSISGSK